MAAPKKPAKPKKGEKPPPPNDFVKKFFDDIAAGKVPTPEPEAPIAPPAPTMGGLTGALEIVGRADRQHLETWWRETMMHVEHVLQRRAEMMASATEHPNEIFARLALAFGAEGKPVDVAAVLLGMSQEDFRLHYGHEWALGSAEITSQVAANFIRIALSSNDSIASRAAREFLDRRGKEEWKPPAQKLELTRPQENGSTIDAASLSYDDRQALKAIILRATVKPGLAGHLEGPAEGEEA
jgi:hypothetical protein